MQYPTIGQPQYGFAPTMPGMASGGLASLPVKKFQSGGFSIGTAPAQSGVMDTAFSPIAGTPVVNSPVGPLGITPATIAGLVAPQLSVPLGLIGLGYNAVMAKQEPAPIMEAKTAAEVEAQQAQMDADIAAAQDAEDAAQGLAMMNQMQAQQEQNVSPVDVAATVAATADAVDAEAGAANAAAAQGPGAMDQGIGGISEAMGGGGGEAPGGGGFTAASQNVDNMMGADPSTASGPSEGSEGASPSYQYGGRVMNYEQGGLAAARQAQSKGRGQDTMLVHMTPGEVKGLQALAMSQGGSLTINPQTGLPEAGFLSKILPMVAGFALGPAGFGLMSSIQAGLTVGALTGVATGSLKKGLMAGLGAYGGAGIGEGLVGAANATTPVATGAEAGLTSASEMAASNLSPELLNSPITTSTSGIDPGLLESSGLTPKSSYFKMAQSNIDPGLLEGMGGTPGMTAQQVATAPVISPTPSIPTSPTTGFESAGTGFKNMFDTGQVGTDARSAFMKGSPTGSLTAAGTTLASALTPEPAPLPTSKSFIRGYDLDITNPSGTPMYTPQDTREREQVRYTYSPREIYEAAQGGLTALNGHTYDDEYGRDEYKAGGQAKARSKSLKGEPYYKFADSRRDSSMEAAVDQNFAKGGLGSALPPRFLSGGGDGMSDSIKANIDGKQEARLADGEFVVPADVVSHLGNGSSKAGAKKLYAMMDKIRKARTGRKSQAPEVNARKYMPA
jgi:hypothetical protein